nr:immunoglobulin light chain junction region [Macaca mulatta]
DYYCSSYTGIGTYIF